jgi:preprotein translocase subunit SecD
VHEVQRELRYADEKLPGLGHVLHARELHEHSIAAAPVLRNHGIGDAELVHAALQGPDHLLQGFRRDLPVAHPWWLHRRGADEMAALLRAGALPAQMRYLQELTVGASLGRDSIRAGVVAAGIAILLVAAFMLAYYRLAGVNALVALLASLLILLAAMAFFQATLTLPGIAGIILTLGVSVDTNVLAFERIREELRHGRTPVDAVHSAFARVWVTIVDTHATALIAAAFLFQFGTGPVRGLAVTLAIGLVANVFASYFLSKLLFEWVLRGRRVSALSI